MLTIFLNKRTSKYIFKTIDFTENYFSILFQVNSLIFFYAAQKIQISLLLKTLQTVG